MRNASQHLQLLQLEAVLRAKQQQQRRLECEQRLLQRHHRLQLAFAAFCEELRAMDGHSPHTSQDALEVFLLRQLSALELPTDSDCTSCSVGSPSQSTAGSSRAAAQQFQWRHQDAGQAPAPPPAAAAATSAPASAAMPASAAAAAPPNRQQCTTLWSHHQPVAPADDPFWMMRQACQQAFNPRAHTMSLQDLLQHCADDVRQLTALVQRLEAIAASSIDTGAHSGAAAAPRCAAAPVAAGSCSVAGQPPSSRAAGGADSSSSSGATAGSQADEEVEAIIADIRAIQMGWVGLVWSLFQADKTNLFFEAHLTSWATGVPLAEPCRRRHLALVQELGLSREQQQRLATGGLMFRGLIAPILAQRQRAHAQGLLLPQRDAAAAATAAAGDRGAVGASAVSAAYSSHGAELQAQQEQTDVLALMQRKDAFLRGCHSLYAQGCLSWVQQARVRIIMAPYSFNVGTFVRLLLEHMQPAPGEALRPTAQLQGEQEEEAAGYASDGVSMECGPA